MSKITDDTLLLPREVASMLRLKVNSVYAAAAAGKLPAVRLWRGRRKSLLRFRREDIERLMLEGVATSDHSSRRHQKFHASRTKPISQSARGDS